MRCYMQIKINDHTIGHESPVYFIADLAANHDGSLDRAIELIHLAKDAGADAAKFQNFKAHQIVSDVGFKSLDMQLSHQKSWDKSVFEVYQDASIPTDWTAVLKNECDQVGIEYLTTPYDFESVDLVDPFVPAYKIGSGDIDWLELIDYMAKKNKPMILSSGASELDNVVKAVNCVQKSTHEIVLMQCNTNYTNSIENFKYINLNVLKIYAQIFPEVILGLSDHTPGHATVLGAIALGARVIEKHFTDDNARVGPDHAFSMNPKSWQEMVARSRELEYALGSPYKKIEDNERETAIVQRRCVRAGVDIQKGDVINRDMLEVLRPATSGAVSPSQIYVIFGCVASRAIAQGEEIRLADVIS